MAKKDALNEYTVLIPVKTLEGIVAIGEAIMLTEAEATELIACKAVADPNAAVAAQET